MFIYVLFWFLVFILSFKIKKNKFTIYDFLFLATIILFSGLRATGNDYFLYKRIYSHFSVIGGRTGIGFDYLIYLFKFIFNFDYQCLIFLISFLTNCFIFYYIKNNSNRPGLAMLIYISAGFYTTSFNMFRQTLSISLVLLANMFLERKKYLKAVLSCFFAIGFHSSSIIAIVLYLFIGKFKHNKIKFINLIPIPIIALLLYNQIFYKVITLFDSYSLYLTYDSTPGLGTYINVLVYLVLTIFFIIPKYGNDKLNDYNNYNLVLIGVSIMILELKNFLFFRIAFYFTILIPLILSNSYDNHDFRHRKIESLIFYFALFIYFLVYINSFDGVLPYEFFF